MVGQLVYWRFHIRPVIRDGEHRHSVVAIYHRVLGAIALLALRSFESDRSRLRLNRHDSLQAANLLKNGTKQGFGG
jgi:hypothetical protein